MVQAVVPTVVVGLQTRPIAATVPTANQALAWSGTAWAPAGPFLPLAGGVMTGPVTLPAGSSANRAFNVQGVVDGSNAAAGMVGEFMSATGGSAGLTNQTWTSLVSLSLTPGDWDVTGFVSFNPPAATIGQYYVGISSVANATPSYPYLFLLGGPNSFGSSSLSTVPVRVNISATTTIYCSTYVNFTGSCNATGVIQAQRMR